MSRAKTDGGSPAGIPDCNDGSGPGGANLKNTKGQFGPKPNMIGKDAGTPDTNAGSGMTQTSDHWPVVAGKNMEGAGNPGTEPSPDTINRGYTAITDGDVPVVVEVPSANRIFPTDPGVVVLESDRGMDDDAGDAGPTVPMVGRGGTGD